MAQETRTLVTVEEFERLRDEDVRRELVRGEVIEVTPSGAEHSMIGAGIAAELRRAARAGGWGQAFGADCGFILAAEPGSVRAPDAAFVRTARLPSGRVPKSFFPGAPDLAVEVVSPDDTAAELHAKVGEYFAAGAQLVWVVYPEGREVYVYRSAAEIEVVGVGGILGGDPVLPGLSIPVAEIFAL
jgi:Uma2 family endonuclease